MGSCDDRGQRAVEIQEQQEPAGALDASFQLFLRPSRTGRRSIGIPVSRGACLCVPIHGTSGKSNLSRADRILPAQR